MSNVIDKLWKLRNNQKQGFKKQKKEKKVTIEIKSKTQKKQLRNQNGLQKVKD